MMGKEMKFGIITILLATILALIPCLPVRAQDSANITITLIGAKEFSINLTPANWSFGDVSPDTEYKTDLTQFTLAVDPASNCNVNTFITGEDAVCVDDPTYVWTLSSAPNNDVRTYALWFKGWDMGAYTQITKEQTQFRSLSMTPDERVNFGLKLLTPRTDFTEGTTGYFSVGDATMQTHVTISAVAA
jgi:hypothetical protein